MQVQQRRPLDVWPSGDGQAVGSLRQEPADLAQRFGLEFEEGEDDLDTFVRAAIGLRDGSQVWLVRHVHNPVSGTVIWADADADPAAVRSAVLDALDLSDIDLDWVPPKEAPTPSRKAWR